MFVIRHKPTGWFMPRGKGRGGRGGTFQSPEPLSDCTRLFASKAGAARALAWWLDGETSAHWVGDWDGQEHWTTIPRPERRAEDMEIVSAEIVVAK